jgi:ligand-binding SRPBCC domain-containing protein
MQPQAAPLVAVESKDSRVAAAGEGVFETELWLPRSPEQVFPFFADAGNLERITPPWLKFEVLTPPPIVMRTGTLIDYRLQVHGVPLRWRTGIAEWTPPHRFVDTQVRGPYRLWHHTHTFEARDGGTLCRDRVRYRAPGGALVHWLFVRRDVDRIFAYRRDQLRAILGAQEEAAQPPNAKP